nr:MAG TPA: Z DNA-binding protein [Caudoviricetes sp.]
MKLNKLTPRQALIYDALIPPGMPVRGKELARRTRISERDLRSERKAMQEQGVPIVTGDFGYMLVDESNPEPLLRYAKRLNAHGDEELATAAMAQQIYERLVTAR